MRKSNTKLFWFAQNMHFPNLNQWKFHCLFVLFLFFSLQIAAQPTLQWSKNYGGTAEDIATGVFPTVDGGCILTGYSFSKDLDLNNSNGGADAWFAKISNGGNTQWKKTLGGTGFDKAVDVLRTADGGFVILTNTNSNDQFENNGGQDILLSKLSSNGTLIWEMVIGGQGNDIAKAIVPDGIGGFYIAGSSYTNFSLNHLRQHAAALLLRVNSQGEVLWNKTYETTAGQFFEKIARRTDGNLVLVGQIHSADNMQEAAIWGISALGDVQWTKTWGGAANDCFTDVLLTQTNEIVVTGWTFSKDGNVLDHKGGKDICFVKYNNVGSLQWSKTFGGCGNEMGIKVLEHKEFYWLLGNSNSIDGDITGASASGDVFLAQLSTSGELDWVDIIGGTNLDVLKDATINSNGSVFMAGYSESNDGDVFDNFGKQDFWLVKTQTSNPVDTMLVAISLGEDVQICSGETVELDISDNCGNCNYVWNDGYTDALRIISPTASVDYEVTITDLDDTQHVGTISVEVFPPIELIINQTEVSCNGQNDGALNLDISGGDGDYSVLWNTGFTTPNLQNLSANIYSVTVTDGNACSSTNTVTLTGGELSLSASLNSVACYSASTGAVNLTITGGALPYVYEWSNGATSANLENIPAGNYTVLVSDQNDCTASGSFLIGESVPMGTLSSVIEPISGQANGTIELIPYGGNSPYSIVWNTENEGFNINNLEAGDYAYTLTDNNGCTFEESIQLGMSTAISPIERTSIALYPNPTDGLVYLNIEQRGTVQLFSIRGEKVYEKQIMTSEKLDLAHLNAGVYYLKYQTIGGEVMGKQLIIH